MPARRRPTCRPAWPRPSGKAAASPPTPGSHRSAQVSRLGARSRARSIGEDAVVARLGDFSGARVGPNASVRGSILGHDVRDRQGALGWRSCQWSVTAATSPPERRSVGARRSEVRGVKTLVTGGAGFIGSTLVDRLLAEGHRVDVVDDLSTGSLANLAGARGDPNHQFSFHQLDIRSPDVIELMARRQPEVVFHLAAQADVRVSVARPVLRRRDQRDRQPAGPRGGPGLGRPQGRVRVQRGDDLRRPRRRPTSRSRSPIRSGRCRPTAWPRRWWATTSTPTGSCTTSSTPPWPWPTCTGPARTPTARPAWSPSSPAGCWPRQPCTIFGDGSQTRDFVFVDDVVDAFARAAGRGSGLIINIGTAVETSVNKLYDTMAAAAGVTDPRHVRARPARASCSARPRPGPGRHPPRVEAVDDDRRGLRGGDRRLPGPAAPDPRVSGTGPPGSGRTISSATEDSRSQAGVDAPDDGDGDPVGLAHDQLGGGGQLVGDADLGDLQLPAQARRRCPAGRPRRRRRPTRWPRRSRPAARSGRRCRTRSRRPRRRAWPAGRRGCGGPSGRSPAAAGRPSRARRWTGRRRRWRRRTRGWSRS